MSSFFPWVQAHASYEGTFTVFYVSNPTIPSPSVKSNRHTKKQNLFPCWFSVVEYAVDKQWKKSQNTQKPIDAIDFNYAK